MAKLFIEQMGYVPGEDGEVAPRQGAVVIVAAADLVSSMSCRLEA